MDIHRSRILVPLDGSRPGDESLAVASSIAHVTDAEIHVLHVSATPLSQRELIESLGISAAQLSRISLHNAVGHAGPAICDFARTLGADAILLASHGRTGDMRKVAGHVTIDVLAHAPCPVYVVRSALHAGSQAHRLRYLRRILVPLDRSAAALAATRYASSLAGATQAQLHLLHVLSEDPALRRAPVAPAYIDQPQHEFTEWAREFEREAFAGAPCPPNVRCVSTLRVGDPGQEIAAYASETDCDLLVLAWAGSMAGERAAVVHTLLKVAPCPMLFVRIGADDRH